MRLRLLVKSAVALVAAATLSMADGVEAASCCGGGSSTSLIMPKLSRAMLDVSFDLEKYNGYWDTGGDFTENPPGSDLSQYRVNLGYAKRLGDNWQASAIFPYIWNDNRYSGVTSGTNGPGDMTLNLWYEAFDKVTCLWNVTKPEDLIPAAYFGASLTVPTGKSPHDNVANSFDVTGRGFYRLDLSAILEKTVYPWTVTFQYSYGFHRERPVNREYGRYVEPYTKKLGDRRLWTISAGYTYFLESMNSVTGTVGYSDLWEGKSEVDGHMDPTTGLLKKSMSFTGAWSSMDRNRVIKFTWSHAFRQDEYGRNFPTTDIFTIGISHVFR